MAAQLWLDEELTNAQFIEAYLKDSRGVRNKILRAVSVQTALFDGITKKLLAVRVSTITLHKLKINRITPPPSTVHALFMIRHHDLCSPHPCPSADHEQQRGGPG